MYTIYYLVVVDDVCAGARHFIRVSALESGSRLRCHLPLATEAQIPFHFLSILVSSSAAVLRAVCLLGVHSTKHKP